MIIPAKIVTWQIASLIKPRLCLQTNGGCFSLYLGVIIASDNILTFPRIPVHSTAVRTLDKKTWFTCTLVLSCCPCTETTEWSRNGAWLTLRRLPIFTVCKVWRKKKLESGAKGFIPAEDIDQIKLAFTYRGLKHTGSHPRINNTKM